MSSRTSEHMRILLAGNPNCGKSTLFNALTGGHAKTGNWHGVTVGMTERAARLNGKRASVTDLPGIYTLSSPNMEEEISRRALEGKDYAAALVVADALTLPRSLRLFYEVKARAPQTLLVVTMGDLLKRRGGFLDEKALSARLGAPVLCVNAHSRRDIRKLRAFLAENLFCGNVCGKDRPVVRKDAASLEGIWSGGAFRESRAERFLYKPYIAVPLFFMTLLAVFFFAFANNMPGELLKGLLEEFVAVRVGGALSAWARNMGAAEAAAGFVSALFSGLGMLLSFLPQIAILYFALFMMEESGYMSALAFMTDGIFRKAGLTGRAAFSRAGWKTRRCSGARSAYCRTFHAARKCPYISPSYPPFSRINFLRSPSFTSAAYFSPLPPRSCSKEGRRKRSPWRSRTCNSLLCGRSQNRCYFIANSL